jgi:hypothetical protein
MIERSVMYMMYIYAPWDVFEKWISYHWILLYTISRSSLDPPDGEKMESEFNTKSLCYSSGG